MVLVQLSFNLNDARDGNRFQILADRFGLTKRELAILIIKKFLNDTFWEWNGEYLSGKVIDDIQIKTFNEYLDTIVKPVQRSDKVGKDFRKP